MHGRRPQASKAGPDLIAERNEDIGLEVKKKDQAEHQGHDQTDQGFEPKGLEGHGVHFQACVAKCLGLDGRAIGCSLTGQLTAAAKTPNAIDKYQTMS